MCTWAYVYMTCQIIQSWGPHFIAGKLRLREVKNLLKVA